MERKSLWHSHFLVPGKKEHVERQHGIACRCQDLWQLFVQYSWPSSIWGNFVICEKILLFARMLPGPDRSDGPQRRTCLSNSLWKVESLQTRGKSCHLSLFSLKIEAFLLLAWHQGLKEKVFSVSPKNLLLLTTRGTEFSVIIIQSA